MLLNSALDEDTVVENACDVAGDGFNAQVTRVAKKIYANSAFEKVVLFIIVINAAWIGVDVDWNNGEGGTVPPLVFTIAENIFCTCFTFELLVRFFTYEMKVLFFKDPDNWKSNCFDLFLVTMMVADVWVISVITDGSALNQFSLIRLLRLMRLLRISRIFRMVPELGIMVKGMAGAARSVSTALVVLVGICYVFGVIFTNWAKGHGNPCFEEMQDDCFLTFYFGSISGSLVTLLQILVFDNMFLIIRPVLADTWYMGWLLLIFMVLGSWTVLNMLIGILCEIIQSGTTNEKMKILESRVQEIFAQIDTDGSGLVSRKEFFRNPDVHQGLEKIGISRSIMNGAFEILDPDGSGDFSLEDFQKVVFKLLNPPQSQDLMKISSKMSQIVTHFNIQNPSTTPASEVSHKCNSKFKRSKTMNAPEQCQRKKLDSLEHEEHDIADNARGLKPDLRKVADRPYEGPPPVMPPVIEAVENSHDVFAPNHPNGHDISNIPDGMASSEFFTQQILSPDRLPAKQVPRDLMTAPKMPIDVLVSNLESDVHAALGSHQKAQAQEIYDHFQQHVQELNQKLGRIAAGLQIRVLEPPHKCPPTTSPFCPSAPSPFSSLMGTLLEGGDIDLSGQPTAQYDLRTVGCKSSVLTPQQQAGQMNNGTPSLLTSHPHPFALAESTDVHSEGQRCRDDEALDWLDAHQRSQALEIYQNLQQLVQSTEKVEEALRLVHGMPLWESSDAEAVDHVLQGLGLQNLPASEKEKASDLLKEYVSLECIPDWNGSGGKPNWMEGQLHTGKQNGVLAQVNE